MNSHNNRRNQHDSSNKITRVFNRLRRQRFSPKKPVRDFSFHSYIRKANSIPNAVNIHAIFQPCSIKKVLTGLFAELTLFFINLSPMTDCHCENDQLIILYQTNQSVVADSVPPLTCSVGSQRFAVNAGIFAADKVLNDPCF